MRWRKASRCARPKTSTKKAKKRMPISRLTTKPKWTTKRCSAHPHSPNCATRNYLRKKRNNPDGYHSTTGQGFTRRKLGWHDRMQEGAGAHERLRAECS